MAQAVECLSSKLEAPKKIQTTRPWESKAMTISTNDKSITEFFIQYTSNKMIFWLFT
jgi:hypothetical protein